MVSISKEEKELISYYFPEVKIVRVTKQKSRRHSYLCEESAEVKDFLANFRYTDDEVNDNGRGKYGRRKRKHD